MTVRGELRATSPPARHDVDGCKKCLSLEVKASFRRPEKAGRILSQRLKPMQGLARMRRRRRPT